MIVQAVHSKIRFTHIWMDGFYGNHPWLLTKIETLNLFYVADISSDEHIYTTSPEYGIPQKKSNKGRTPTRFTVLNTQPVRVDDLIKTVVRWRIMRIRKSMSGFLEVKFTVIIVR